jgi:hydroxyethylthiazole kinase
MIISPPFIPAPVEGESDDEFLARAMVGGAPGDGGYPLSFDLNWHGGVHLTAPQEEGRALPVRAISDGTLVYVRMPTSESSDPDHPLRYRDTWTDDGCVVIKHETEIGEGEKAKVIFYSIYMHLSRITLGSPQKGKAVYRKDSIGDAGSIYGEKGRIHFEIVADHSQLESLVGRSTGDLSFQVSQGRTDCFWGDVYFFIPAEVLIYERPPHNKLQVENDSEVVYRCPAMPTAPAPVQEAGQVSAVVTDTVQGYDWATATELQKGLFVRMSYCKGQCKFTTITDSGFELGVQNEVANFEYDLYKIATDLFPNSPSAGFELLRFGRVLGEDRLVPSDAAHWRQVKVPGKSGERSKSGWVDLNSLTVTRFSDADFPHWQGWRLIDDDSDLDSHCQSPFVRAFLALDINNIVSDNTDAVGIVTSAAYESLSSEEQKRLSLRYAVERDLIKAKLESVDVQESIKRFVCKFPSEWRESDFDTRFGWLKKVSENEPMPEERYAELKSHQQALAFWEDAALDGIEHAHWHFPPKEFIRTFSRCGWLSANDLKGIYPAAAGAKIAKYVTHINRTLLKYLVVGAVRRSHFFGQAGIETNQLGWMSELYNGDPYTYFRRYANARNFKGWLGNVKYNDGGDFRGRGMKQLTGRANYAGYWVYRGWLQISSYSNNWWRNSLWWGISGNTVAAVQYSTLPIQNAAMIAQLDATMRPPTIINPERVNSEPFTCADTAGWFWAKNKLIKIADMNDISEMTRKIRGDGASVGVTTPWPEDAKFAKREELTNKLLKHF